MSWCLRILFCVLAVLAVFGVTCSCIIPFDTEEIPDREPMGIAIAPTRIRCLAAPLEENEWPCMVRAVVVFDDGSTDRSVMWDVPTDAVHILSTAGGILTFRVVKEGVYTIRAMTMPYQRKDKEVVTAECQVVAVSLPAEAK